MSIAALNWSLSPALNAMQVGKSARHILTLLANYADERGVCFPSNALLAQQSEMTARSVQTQIEILEEAKLLTRARKRRRDGRLGITRYLLAVDGVVASLASVENDSTGRDDDEGEGDPPETVSGGEAPPENHASPPAIGAAPPETGDANHRKPFPVYEPPNKPSPIPQGEGGGEGKPKSADGPSEAAAVESSLTALLHAWGARSSIEDVPKVRRTLAGMVAADRTEAVASVPAFLEFHKTTGRRHLPSLVDFLAERLWRHVLEAAKTAAAIRKAAAPGPTGPQVASLLTRRWWALIWRRHRQGAGARLKLRWIADMANAGTGVPVKPGEEVTDAEEAALLQVETASPAAALALSRLADAGFRLRIDIAVPYVWVPASESPAPPPAEAGGQ
jgi:hypothetical protein